MTANVISYKRLSLGGDISKGPQDVPFNDTHYPAASWNGVPYLKALELVNDWNHRSNGNTGNVARSVYWIA